MITPTYQIRNKIQKCTNSSDVSALIENECNQITTEKSKFYIDLKAVFIDSLKDNPKLLYYDIVIAFCDEKKIYWKRKERAEKIRLWSPIIMGALALLLGSYNTINALIKEKEIIEIKIQQEQMNKNIQSLYVGQDALYNQINLHKNKP